MIFICDYVHCDKEYERKYKTQKYCSTACGHLSIGLLFTQRAKKRYDSKPKLCRKCNNKIPFEKKDNVFCDSACAAAFNNSIPKRKKRAAACLHCDIVLSKNRTKYCSTDCEWKHTIIPRILAGEARCHNSLKRYLTELYGYKCKKCNIFEWNNQRLVLQLDHVDGNSDNNFPDNLRMLCPNCHSLTPTYKGGNKASLKDTKRNRMHREIYLKKSERRLHTEGV